MIKLLALHSYYSEHKIVYMAVKEEGSWDFSEVTGPVEFPSGNPIQQGWREAAVLFLIYPWGKPQPPIYRGNAEGAKLHRG